MPHTIRDVDTALLSGAGDATLIGHFYLEVPRRRLHCLNDVARQLRAAGVPLLETEPALAQLSMATGGAVQAADWPVVIAARQGRSAEGEYLLARPGQPGRRLQYCVTPMKDGSGQIGALLVTVVCAPPSPDWPTLAGLAHDLRTPLQSVATMRHVLDFRTLPEEQRQEALERLGHAAERAQQIAQELLEWCRTRATAGPAVQREWSALEPLLREILAEQALAASQKRLTMTADLRAVRGWQMLTDRGKLARILANLLVNAVRYTPEGGKVSLRTRWQDENGARALALAVHDTGAGIAQHEQESIFNPFERGQSGREHDSTGSGVGLSVVDRLTQELGLGYDVHSAAGEGSQFRVLVPQQLLRMAPKVT
jgi:hypothetical protein